MSENDSELLAAVRASALGKHAPGRKRRAVRPDPPKIVLEPGCELIVGKPSRPIVIVAIEGDEGRAEIGLQISTAWGFIRKMKRAIKDAEAYAAEVKP